jgi:hypothetical protein
MTKSSDLSPVKQVLEQLVDHFNQNIHVVGIEKTEVPYFDTKLSHNNGSDGTTASPPVIISPPTVQYWLKEILSPSPSLADITAWIQGYNDVIRPLLLASSDPSDCSSRGYIPTLQNYELVLSQWMKNRTNINQNQENVEELQNIIYQNIELISTDITLITSTRFFPNVSSHLRCNILLPTLLRLLQKTLEIISILGDVTEVGSDRCRSLRRCVVSLLAFESPVISPCNVAPSLIDPTRHCIDRLCYFPPAKDLNIFSKEDVAHLNLSLEFNPIDWEGSVSLSTAAWNDSNTGVSFRMAESVWNQLGRYLLKCNPDDVKKKSNDFGIRNEVVSKLGGVGVFFKDIRLHFFGRDMIEWEPTMRSSQLVVLGRRIAKTQPVINESPFEAIPSRIAVAMNGLDLLLPVKKDHHDENNIAISTWKYIFEDVFPVCASLVDSNRSLEIGLGASGLLRLLDSFVESGVSLNELSEESRKFVDNLLSVLDLAFQTTREGPAAVIIGQTQSRTFDLLQDQGGDWEKEYRHRRRKVTQQWLTTLARSTNQTCSDSRSWELLVGGAIPLLLQHAKNEPTGDAMEMGRLGLTALLILIDADAGGDERTIVASIVGLINLLFGAHPMMENHGGKIMCTLISTATSAASDSPLYKLVSYVAAVSLLICGPKFTSSILDSIQKDTERYQENFKSTVFHITGLAEKIHMLEVG